MIEYSKGDKMKKKYAFFGGSFNPPTYGHIGLAQNAVKKFELDKLFFVPVGNKYNKQGLIDEKHRYNMLKIACKNQNKLDVSDIELNRDKNFNASEVFKMIKTKYKDDEIYFILGADNLEKMPLWKNFSELLKYNYIILERENKDVQEIINNNDELRKNKDRFRIIKDEALMKISSTKLRNAIKENNIKYAKEITNKEIIDYYIRNGNGI